MQTFQVVAANVLSRKLLLNPSISNCMVCLILLHQLLFTNIIFQYIKFMHLNKHYRHERQEKLFDCEITDPVIKTLNSGHWPMAISKTIQFRISCFFSRHVRTNNITLQCLLRLRQILFSSLLGTTRSWSSLVRVDYYLISKLITASQIATDFLDHNHEEEQKTLLGFSHRQIEEKKEKKQPLQNLTRN